MMIVPPLLRVAAAGAFVLLVALLFVGGAQPEAAGLVEPPWDKVAHFGYFGLLATLAMLAADLRRPALVFIAVVVVGIADELAQTRLPGRYAELGDLAADTAAALCVVVLLALARRRLARRAAA